MGSDLHLPDSGTTAAAAIVVHPHPAMGGDRRHPFVVAVAEGLAARGVVALRADLRDPDPVASAWRLGHLAQDLVREVAAERLVLVGYSWGAVVSSLAAPRRLVGRVLVAPPVAMVDLGDGDGAPTLVLVPAHDQYGGPEPVREAMRGWAATTIEPVDGADHFLAGALARVADRAAGWAADQASAGAPS